MSFWYLSWWLLTLFFQLTVVFFSSYRSYFQDQWEKYLKLRGIWDGKSAPTFPKPFDVKERDQFYSSVSYSGWGGSSGHDAPMIAYDAILAAGDSWKELAHRAFFHGGDSDSTAAIAGCWWGVMYGFIILSTVMVSLKYISQNIILYPKHVQYVTCQLYLQ